MKTTILVEKATRDVLKQIGAKGQSYDNLINWLIRTKTGQIVNHTSERKNSLGSRFATHGSSELS